MWHLMDVKTGVYINHFYSLSLVSLVHKRKTKNNLFLTKNSYITFHSFTSKQCPDNVRTQASKFSVYNVSEQCTHNIARVK